MKLASNRSSNDRCDIAEMTDDGGPAVPHQSDDYWPLEIDTHLRSLRRLEVVSSGRSADVEERWQAYVDSLPARNLASADVAGACDQLWINLYELVADIVPPDAGPTNDGGLLMSWDQKGRHLEIEVYPDTSYEWFFRERTANVTESGTARTVDTISDELAHWLRYLLT